MNKQGEPGIERTDYTWNVVTGCLNHVNGLCKGGGFPCYAYKLANGRLKERYLANKNLLWDSELLRKYDKPFFPRFWPERLREPMSLKSPSRISTVDMGELFGDWIPEEWIRQIFDIIELCPEHTFQLLTKQPQNLAKWSPFPENCWVGITATNQKMFEDALEYLANVQANVRFISYEPALGVVKNVQLNALGWLIIGAQTRPTVYPKIEWVQEIVEACNKADIPYFLKDNLKPLALPMSAEYYSAIPWDESQRGMEELRQEFPC